MGGVKLDVKVLDRQGLGPDKLPAGGDFLAQEQADGTGGCAGVSAFHPQHLAVFRVRGSVPQRLGVHFIQSFVALQFRCGEEGAHPLYQWVFFRVSVGVLLDAAALHQVKRWAGDVSRSAAGCGYGNRPRRRS